MYHSDFLEKAHAIREKYQLERGNLKDLKTEILGQIVKSFFMNGDKIPTTLQIECPPRWIHRINKKSFINVIKSVLTDLSIPELEFQKALLIPSNTYLEITFCSK